MTTAQKIIALDNAKTKFDISYMLDMINSGEHNTLLMDVRSKADVVALKNETLKKLKGEN